ncbi:MAG: hypothetical protein IKN04_06525 [Clostridia bacterium]|nr:hypothetical protein [Clostridia bacterium]
MADLITWSGNGGISFFIKSSEIRGVKDFSISASAETDDKTQNGEKFIKKKNSGSYQITMTAVLNAALGVDVQAVALKMTEAARKGDTGYFYTATSKLFPSNFMATDAKVNNIQMTSSGKWSYCEVALTLKQCSKFDGGSSGGGGGGGGKKSNSGKKTTTQTKKTTLGEIVGKVVNGVKTVVSKVKNAITGVVNTISAAKKASNAAKTNLTTKKTNVVSTVVSKIKSFFGKK